MVVDICNYKCTVYNINGGFYHQLSVSIALTRFKNYLADSRSVGEKKASDDLGIPVGDLVELAELEPNIERVKGTFKWMPAFSEAEEHSNQSAYPKHWGNLSSLILSPNLSKVIQSHQDVCGVVPSEKPSNQSYLAQILSQE